VHTTFPHRFESDAAEDDRARERYPWEADPGAFYTWFFNSPFADEALFALAKEAVLALQLGQDGATDLLAIAIKSMDRIGHDYGPRSQEQLDIFVRLDRLLAGLLDFLDETVGEDHYIVAVSADHGAPNIVEYELEQRADNRGTDPRTRRSRGPSRHGVRWPGGAVGKPDRTRAGTVRHCRSGYDAG
jgi:predicted AlkP superfamily pyrophosphatase or phosphodiesterase